MSERCKLLISHFFSRVGQVELELCSVGETFRRLADDFPILDTYLQCFHRSMITVGRLALAMLAGTRRWMSTTWRLLYETAESRRVLGERVEVPDQHAIEKLVLNFEIEVYEHIA